MPFSLPHNLYQEYIAGQKYAKVQFVQENFDACISASNNLNQSLTSTQAELTSTQAELTSTQAVVQELTQTPTYQLCEFYYFRHPTLKPGFQPAQGGLIENAATLYPEAWAYLQTPAGQLLCKTEAEWQALTTATWATLADGTKVGWNGIGGAPFYVQDLGAGTLRLPDLRGMYAEAAGFDSLAVGGVHGDAIRNIVGTGEVYSPGGPGTGALSVTTPTNAPIGGSQIPRASTISINSSRVVPTAVKNQPRAWGALPCVYLGAPE